MLAMARGARSGGAFARSFHDTKNKALLAASDAIRAQNNAILAANDEDMRAGAARGLSPALLDP